LKEDPSDAVVVSHKLMVRAGLIRKESSGMYVYLPLGLKVLRKIMNVIREEMDNAGALEFLMPELTNAELWKESGRWDTMGAEMFRIKDRNNMEYSLAPTHEEAFTAVIRNIISSYRDLPIIAYQMNTKFRDEIRPRFGVIRSKEFIMKDAYSFDADEKGLEASYQNMRGAYRRIFERCGLETIPVEADTGNMGGSGSEEFMVASEVGEETLLLCDSCGYRANQEKAEFHREEKTVDVGEELSLVNTPDVKTIEDLVAFFKIESHNFIKSIIYLADEKPVMVVVPGDREINEHKLKNHLGAVEIDLAGDDVVETVTGAPVGFAGPIDIKDQNMRVVFDSSIAFIADGITGANKKDAHYKGVNPGRDFTIKDEADLTSAIGGDLCPSCKKAMYEKKGIEVGHIFKLGYKYTKSMNVSVLAESGKALTPIMGCYGVGVNRTLAAVVEQHNDGRGIVWPKDISPFDIHLIAIAKSEEHKVQIDELYERLKKDGYSVLYDDRSASPGFKFADADLIGIPIRITAGKNYIADGTLELKNRFIDEMKKLPEDEVFGELKNL